ncbi:MAG: hypothetical protein LBC56_00390 [Oscillospiraceae bacterium]|jgi:type I restriction-modification system DNA methylase subunit|nr:hypothetical protein [Oscillospiraceae bacterium]
MKHNPYSEKILKTIIRLGHVYSTWNVFTDFVELGALAIANSLENKSDAWQKREERYLEVIKRYRPEERKFFPEIFADLLEALQYELTWSNAPVDVLGRLFHDLELHNQYKGQFFTPQHICDMMGAIALGEDKSAIEEKGYISFSEPCCGSGAMALGFAKAMLRFRPCRRRANSYRYLGRTAKCMSLTKTRRQKPCSPLWLKAQ